MSLNTIVQLIKDANFETILQNEENYLNNVKSGKDVEHILGLCSHEIYRREDFSKEALTSMSKVLTLLLQQAAKESIDFDSLKSLKSLYYILVYGIKKGLDIHSALELANEIEILICLCEEFSLNHSDLLKKMHSALWNASLQKCISPNIALALQSYALGFLSLVSTSFNDSCTFTCRVGKLAEHNKCSNSSIKNLYSKILSKLIICLKRNTTVNITSILPVNQILIEFAKTLFCSKKCNEFSKVFRPIVLSLENMCDPQDILSLKMSVKVVEVGMSYVLGQIGEDQLLKLLSGCSVVSKSSSIANAILIDGLHFVYELLQENKTGKFSTAISSVFKCITERLKPESKFNNDSLLKILDIYGSHLNYYVTVITSTPDGDKAALITEAGDAASALSILKDRIERFYGEIHVYNIGINCCNLGVISFKNNSYDVASRVLDLGVQYLLFNYTMCQESQKNTIMNIIKKKGGLLKDSLRYGGKYREAAVKTLHLVALDVLPLSELIITWIKCRRDAHKANCFDLKKICLKDIYEEVQNELSAIKPEFKIEELLLDEIKELTKLSFETFEEQILCATALSNSDDLEYSIEGSLAYTKIMCLNSSLVTEEMHDPIKILNKTLKKTDKGFSKNEVKGLEYKARIALWMYLRNIQIIQEKAELEFEKTQKESEPLTVQSTDLGEEVQPNDVCSVRPSITVNTFDCQEKNFQHLDHALSYWEQVVEKRKLSKASVACSDLLSIGFIYNLSGVLPSAIKAFTLLLNVANLHNLQEFWIQGVVELIDIIPDLLSIKIAQRILNMLECDAAKTSPKFSEYFRLSATSSVAYLYFRKEEFVTGVKLINECLASPLMEKRTPSATEVQIGTFLVASHYAFLPDAILSKDLKPIKDCFFLALSASRKAIGLANASSDCNFENVCWRHKVAWLHHRTNMWLGRLCYLTVQPRVGRSYLRQALNFAEKFALPLRTAELFCTLSEIDLQCDQLDDCSVKIDSLDSLLNIHNSVDEKKDVSSEEKLPTNSKKSNVPNRFPSMQTNVPVFIYTDNSNDSVVENMREEEASLDFELEKTSLELGNNRLLAFNVKKGIKELMEPNCPPSPNSEKCLRSVFSCSKFEDGICSVCSSPELLSVAVRANVLLGVIYANRDNTRGSQLCFDQAQKDIDQTLKYSSETMAHLCSILKLASSDQFELITENKEEKSQFIPILMGEATLSLLFHRNKTHSWNVSNSVSVDIIAKDTLKHINDQYPMIWTLNHTLVLQLILTCGEILNNKNYREEEKTEVLSMEAAYCSPSVSSKTEAISSFKTPLQSRVKKPYNRPLRVSNTRPTPTPFRIFTDDDESSSSGEMKKSIKIAKSRKENELSNLTSSFGKMCVGTKTNCKLNFSTSSNNSPRLSPLSSQVLELASKNSRMLELPSREYGNSEVTKSGDVKPTSPSQSKTGKLINKKPTNKARKVSSEDEVITLPSSVSSTAEDVKKPSLIKTKYARRTVKATTDVAAGKAPTINTRETRSRRNLQRL